jgi:hypothetical protein
VGCDQNHGMLVSEEGIYVAQNQPDSTLCGGRR